MTVWRGMGAAVKEGSPHGLPVKSEPAMCCDFFNTLPDHYSPLGKRIPFQEGNWQGLSLPPRQIPSLWIKAFHIWSGIRSSTFLMRSEKSNASNPAHHLAPAPHQLGGSLWHSQQLCAKMRALVSQGLELHTQRV